MAKIVAKSMEEAWDIANRMFPTDYLASPFYSERAGYPVYTTTSDDEKFNDFHINDLGCRLELCMGAKTVNVWVEEEEEGSEVIITLKNGHKDKYTRRENAVVNFVDNGHIKFYNITVGEFVTSYRVEQIASIMIQ